MHFLGITFSGGLIHILESSKYFEAYKTSVMCCHRPLQQCGSFMCLNRFWKTKEEKYKVRTSLLIGYVVFSCESLHRLMCLFCLMKVNWALTLFYAYVPF